MKKEIFGFNNDEYTKNFDSKSNDLNKLKYFKNEKIKNNANERKDDDLGNKLFHITSSISMAYITWKVTGYFCDNFTEIMDGIKKKFIK